MFGAKVVNNKQGKEKILAVEMDFLHRSCRKIRLEHVRSEDMGNAVIEEKR